MKEFRIKRIKVDVWVKKSMETALYSADKDGFHLINTTAQITTPFGDPEFYLIFEKEVSEGNDELSQSSESIAEDSLNKTGNNSEI